MTVVAFDLDGTLSDPAVGITASINFALERLGAQSKNPANLVHYIGPPLDAIFSELLKTDSTIIIDQAVQYYRERYISVGYTENILYQGIRAVLHNLRLRDVKLYVATSKRTDIAQSVVEYFGLQPYFIQVLGCGLKRKKHELLREIMEKEDDTALIMIGDRAHDMTAGRKVGAQCTGVLWGFGSAEELNEAGADALIHHPHEILDCMP